MTKKYLTLPLTLFFAAACGQKQAEQPAPQAPEQTASGPAQLTKETGNTMEKLSHPETLNETAPETFKVKLTTTKGDAVISVTRSWAPRGADRFYNLVKNGFFTDTAFFRVIDGFMVQFGIHGNPSISAKWRGANIEDDPVKQSNGRGYVSFATAGPGTRTTQMFINFGNNSFLDGQGFSPFGKVTEGMDVIDSLYKGYGEGAPSGDGPDQGSIQMKGNEYLKAGFPKLDYIKSAEII